MIQDYDQKTYNRKKEYVVSGEDCVFLTIKNGAAR